MKLKLYNIELCNFKSYKNFSFDSPSAPGFYFISGKNGSGKSNFISALSWVMFGKDQDGLFASDICQWKAGKNVLVTAVFETNEGVILVERGWKPSRFGVFTSPEEGPDTEYDFGITHTAFLNSVVIGQFSQKFFDMRPAERLEVFNNILGLDFWDKCIAKAKAMRDKFEAELTKNRNAIARTEGELSILQKSDCRERFDNWEKDNASKIKHCEEQLSQIEIDENFEISKAKKQDEKIGKELVIDERALRNYSTLKGICDRCGEPVDAKKVEKRKKELKINIEKLKKKLSKINIDIVRYKKWRDFDEELARLNKLKNPFKDQLKTIKHDIADRKKMIELGLKKQKKIEAKKIQSEFWIKGFKDVKLMIVGKSLDELNAVMNGNLSALGLFDWKMKLVIDQETSSGKIKKGLDILVNSPERVDYTSVKTSSGGEYTRLKLATIFSIIDFVQDRTGVYFADEFWDEPTAWLEAEGIEALLSLLSERAAEKQKRIFLIDHRDFEDLDFDGICKVTRDKNGSRLEML